jgi:hypothetical protein
MESYQKASYLTRASESIFLHTSIEMLQKRRADKFLHHERI